MHSLKLETSIQADSFHGAPSLYCMTKHPQPGLSLLMSSQGIDQYNGYSANTMEYHELVHFLDSHGWPKGRLKTETWVPVQGLLYPKLLVCFLILSNHILFPLRKCFFTTCYLLTDFLCYHDISHLFVPKHIAIL